MKEVKKCPEHIEITKQIQSRDRIHNAVSRKINPLGKSSEKRKTISRP
jgi:hypothetical protein